MIQFSSAVQDKASCQMHVGNNFGWFSLEVQGSGCLIVFFNTSEIYLITSAILLQELPTNSRIIKKNLVPAFSWLSAWSSLRLLSCWHCCSFSGLVERRAFLVSSSNLYQLKLLYRFVFWYCPQNSTIFRSKDRQSLGRLCKKVLILYCMIFRVTYKSSDKIKFNNFYSKDFLSCRILSRPIL